MTRKISSPRFVGLARLCMDQVVHLSRSELRALGVEPGVHQERCLKTMEPLLGKLGGRGLWMAGGPMANTLARLAAEPGAHVTLLGRHGADHAGQAVREDMRQRGLHFKGTAALAGCTERCIVFVTREDGERTFVYDPGVADLLLAHDVEQHAQALQGAHYLLLGLPFRASVCDSALARAQHYAQKAWHVAGLQGYHRAPQAVVKRLLTVDLLVGNSNECKHLLQDAGYPSLQALSQGHPHLLLACTQGTHGVALWQAGQVQTIPAEQPTSSALDSTGAGDAWLAGFVWAHARGASPAEAAALGAHWATTVLAVPGGRLPCPAT